MVMFLSFRLSCIIDNFKVYAKFRKKTTRVKQPKVVISSLFLVILIGQPRSARLNDWYEPPEA